MTADLIERLERATGPDRELDGKIALSVGWTFEKMKGDARPYYRKPGVTEYYRRSEHPHFTSSLDAAQTLVPEGWDVSISRHRGDVGNYASVFNEGLVDEPHFHFDGNKPISICLCIAALKARAHQS